VACGRSSAGRARGGLIAEGDAVELLDDIGWIIALSLIVPAHVYFAVHASERRGKERP